MNGETINGVVETIEQLEKELEKYKWVDLIVFCRDCKHHRIVSDGNGPYAKCELHSGMWWNSDFCSRGERKESDGE